MECLPRRRVPFRQRRELLRSHSLEAYLSISLTSDCLPFMISNSANVLLGAPFSILTSETRPFYHPSSVSSLRLLCRLTPLKDSFPINVGNLGAKVVLLWQLVLLLLRYRFCCFIYVSVLQCQNDIRYGYRRRTITFNEGCRRLGP